MSSTQEQSAQIAIGPAPAARVGIYVLAAVLLLELISAILARRALFGPVYDPSTDGLLPLTWLAVLGGTLMAAAPAAFLMYMAHARRLWALVLLIGLTAFNIIIYVYDVTEHRGVWSSPAGDVALAANVGNLVGIAFLLSRQSLSWFRSGSPVAHGGSGRGRERPWSVRMAVLLYGVAIAFALLTGLLDGHIHQHGDSMYAMSRVLLLLFAIPAVAVKLFALYHTCQRRNWARLLFSLLAVATGYFAAVDINSMISLMDGAVSQALWIACVNEATPGLLAAASVVLLFSRPSNRWFRGQPQVSR